MNIITSALAIICRFFIQYSRERHVNIARSLWSGGCQYHQTFFLSGKMAYLNPGGHVQSRRDGSTESKAGDKVE